MYNNFNFKDAFFIGILQGFAVFAGISRSGITIAGLLKRDFSREQAFMLSFLAAIPIMIAAFILEFKELGANEIGFGNMAAGFITAFFTGLLALRIIKKILLNRKFKNFGYYCLVIAFLNLII